MELINLKWKNNELVSFQGNLMKKSCFDKTLYTFKIFMWRHTFHVSNVSRKYLLSILSSEPLGGVPWNRCSQTLNKIIKGTLMQIWKSAYVIVFIWEQFCILNPKNSRVIDTWSLFYFLKIRRLFASFYWLYCWLWTYFYFFLVFLSFCFRVAEVFITRGGLQTLPHFRSEALFWTAPQCRCSRKTEKLLEK